MTDEPGLRALLERFIDFSDGSARYITDRRIPQAMPASCRSAALKLRARLSTPAASDGSLDVGIGLETTRRQLSELIADAESALRHLDSILSQTTVRVGEAGEIYRLSESPSEGKTE